MPQYINGGRDAEIRNGQRECEQRIQEFVIII